MDLTKEQILEKLSFLDRDKLEKLLFYSENIIIPEADLLLNVTMQQIMNKSFALADTYFPEWTDRGIADFGRFLVELFAISSEKDFYYINGFANENLLGKMSVYSDAFMRAVELGYYPNVSLSAKGTFQFTFGPIANAVVIPRGGLIVDAVGEKFSFLNLEPITIPASTENQQITVTLNEGKLVTETFQFNGFAVYISKEKVDTETLILSIDNLEWTRTRTFGQSSSNSKHYVAIPEDTGSIRVFFGDMNYGKRPELNESVKINYLRCSNAKPNNFTGTFRLNKYPTEVSIVGNIVLLDTITGGQEPDTLADLKNKARNYFESNYILNNKYVVERWLTNQYEVKKCYVKIINNQVYFKIVPNLLNIPEIILLQTIKDRMQPLVTGGYFAQGDITTYVPITNVAVQLSFTQGTNMALATEQARRLISDYTNPYVRANYGKSFVKEELSILLYSNVQGLQNVIFTDINGALQDVLISPEQILQKVPDNSISITSAYVV